MSEPVDLVVVAHRLPFELVRDDDGALSYRRSPGGLVSALQSALRNRRALWIGSAGRSCDQGVADALDNPVVAACEFDEIVLDRGVWSPHYLGFCTSALWPLYHSAEVAPVYRGSDFAAYCQVNEMFAARAAARASEGGMVWVHDYQLQLVPSMLRRLRPDVRIGFFLHTPFPADELFEQMPWCRQLLEGMLGADVIGFQTEGDVAHFLAATQRCLALRSEAGRVVVDEFASRRDVAVGCFPVGIDTELYAAAAAMPEVVERAAQIRGELGDPRTLIVAIDRLDYTKGIDLRIRAFAELLTDRTAHNRGVVMVQKAVLSRESAHEYRRVRHDIERLVSRTNDACGGADLLHVDYLQQPLDLLELVAMYVAADIMMVTPRSDGMNLVAKEYVATRLHNDGALILSEFAGAARQLDAAWLVDPHDIAALKNSMEAALAADRPEQQRRMSALRAQVHGHDVDRWCQLFLDSLAQPILT
ncbi:MAG: trehalose-6-phosphate synthase [Actinobacteria bacterium]|uniref:Unannotated protein n=1 Tax=freshwater metagenome TaxID=449393 RepID=A0A6J7IXL4_9ZZZZ|nr:trehalose-6-phosphate synthase [Actinomycetota bacterium]